MTRAIRLSTQGREGHADIVVEIEAERGLWVEVIRERQDGCISHIVEPLGIDRLVEEAKSTR